MWPFSKQKKLTKDEFKEVLAISLELEYMKKNHNIFTEEQIIEELNKGGKLSLDRMKEEMDKERQAFGRLCRITGKTIDELSQNSGKLLKTFLEPYKNTVEFQEWRNKINQTKANKKINEGEFKEVIAMLQKISSIEDELERCMQTAQGSPNPDSIANLKKNRDIAKEARDAFLYRLSELTGKTAEELKDNSEEVLRELLTPYENTDEFQELDNKIKFKNG